MTSANVVEGRIDLDDVFGYRTHCATLRLFEAWEKLTLRSFSSWLRLARAGQPFARNLGKLRLMTDSEGLLLWLGNEACVLWSSVVGFELGVGPGGWVVWVFLGSGIKVPSSGSTLDVARDTFGRWAREWERRLEISTDPSSVGTV